MTEPTTVPAELETKPRRLSMSAIVEMLLQRSTGERHSVSLARNARGVTQIEVTVRASDTGELTTPEGAAEAARRIYDGLCSAYPHPDPPTGGSPDVPTS